MFPFVPDPLVRVVNLQHGRFFTFSFAFGLEITGAHPTQPCSGGEPDFLVDDVLPDLGPTLPDDPGTFWELASLASGELEMSPDADTDFGDTVITMSPQPDDPADAITMKIHSISGVPSDLPITVIWPALTHGSFELVSEGVAVNISDLPGNERIVRRVGNTPVDPDSLPAEATDTYYLPATVTVCTALRGINGQYCRKFESEIPAHPSAHVITSYQGERVEENTVSLDFSNLRIELEDPETGEPEGFTWVVAGMLVPQLLRGGFGISTQDHGLNVQLLMMPE